MRALPRPTDCFDFARTILAVVVAVVSVVRRQWRGNSCVRLVVCLGEAGANVDVVPVRDMRVLSFFVF